MEPREYLISLCPGPEILRMRGESHGGHPGPVSGMKGREDSEEKMSYWESISVVANHIKAANFIE